MTEGAFNTIILGALFLLLFGSAELFYRIFKCSGEVTRKYVHVVTGLLALLFPALIPHTWMVLLLCGSFFVILLISLKLQALPSINAIDRKSWGSLAYPVIVYVCFVVYSKMDHLMYYYMPILILAISDPIANIVGKNWPVGRYAVVNQTKTLSGSTAFCLVSLLIAFALTLFLSDWSILYILLFSFSMAMITTIAEAFSLNGFDNITIPAGALAVLYFFEEFIRHS